MRLHKVQTRIWLPLGFSKNRHQLSSIVGTMYREDSWSQLTLTSLSKDGKRGTITHVWEYSVESSSPTTYKDSAQPTFPPLNPTFCAHIVLQAHAIYHGER